MPSHFVVGHKEEKNNSNTHHSTKITSTITKNTRVTSITVAEDSFPTTFGFNPNNNNTNNNSSSNSNHPVAPITPPLSPRSISSPGIIPYNKHKSSFEDPFPMKKPLNGADLQFQNAEGHTITKASTPEPVQLEAKRVSISFFPEKPTSPAPSFKRASDPISLQKPRSATSPLLLSNTNTLKPTEFVARMFDEHLTIPTVLYNKFEDPFENENHEPFGREIVKKNTQKKNNNYQNPPPAASQPDSFFPVTPSPTFRTNAPEFLRKWNSEEVIREPKIGDVIGLYQLGDVVGMGAFSTVHRGFMLNKPEMHVAIKIVDKRSCDDALLKNVRSEVQIWKTLDHPNIVKFLDVIETNRHVFVISELCERGRLFDYVVDSELGRLEEPEARTIFKQICSAISYLHHLGITHGDVKLDNLLLTKDGVVKLCDFGFSSVEERNGRSHSPPGGKPINKNKNNSSASYSTTPSSFSASAASVPSDSIMARSLSTDSDREGDSLMDHLTNSCGGTLLYSAPEVIKGSCDIGRPSDVWSLGVTLFGVTMGELPFDDDYEPRLKKQILSGRFTFPDDVNFSNELKDLIEGMMTVSVDKRLTIDEVLAHPWLTC